jgi:hypothetical protein
MIVRSKFGFVAPALAVLVLGALTACSPTTTASGGASAASGGGSSGSTNVCSLVGATAASSTMGVTFTGAKSSSFGSGEDACTYAESGSPAALIVSVYQPSSGMTWTTMEGVLGSLGPVKSVSGVGDKAALAKLQLSVQAGSRVIAIEGDSVGTNPSGAEALAKTLVAALG